MTRRRPPCGSHPKQTPPNMPCDGCDTRAITQLCAVCNRRLCPDCYGDWYGLACRTCRQPTLIPVVEDIPTGGLL